LKCDCVPLELKPPSPQEKENILKKLGKPLDSLTVEQKRRLEKSDQFIVLMMELVGGKDLHDIVKNAIERLFQLEHNHSSYYAYEYLCFVGQFGIGIPISLLENLGSFHKLLSRSTVDGLIFEDYQRDQLRAGHPVVAESATKIYVQREGNSPKIIIKKIADAVNAANSKERQFLVRLLKASPSQFREAFQSIKDTVAACVQNAERIGELASWRTLCTNYGEHDLANKCADLAIAREPMSVFDCNRILHFCREREREKDALQPIAKWIKAHPEQGEVRFAYLGLVERCERNDLPRAIQETDQWLDANLTDANLRAFFLIFVEKNQIEKIGYYTDKIGRWLKQHPKNSNVRVAYLAVIERNGTPQQVQEALVNTSEWLDLPENSSDSHVRGAYLSVLGKNAAPQQVEEALIKTSAWLDLPENSSDSWVRAVFLALLKRKALSLQKPSNEVADVWLAAKGLVKTEPLDVGAQIEKATQWLDKNPSNLHIRHTLISLLFSLGKTEEATTMAKKGLEIQNDKALKQLYLRGIRKSAPEEIVGQLLEQILQKHPDDMRAKFDYAAWLRNIGRLDEAEVLYKELIVKSPRRSDPFYGYGELLFQRGRYPEACNMFQTALRMHKGHVMAHLGLAKSLYKFRKYQNAENEFQHTIYWLNRADDWSNVADDLKGPLINEIGNVINNLQKIIKSSDLVKIDSIKSVDESLQKAHKILEQITN
jgi:tetratricopeptide (TPR) repeat protein